MDVDLGLEMKISLIELRVLLLHEFCLGCKATEATSNRCDTMSKDVLSIRTPQHWLNRFKNGNLKFNDLPHCGRSVEVDKDVSKQLVEEDPRFTTRCLAERFGYSHSAVKKHLSELGKRWRYGVWKPHDLSLHRLRNTGFMLVWN